ncbi:M24 family metallopeptidase [Geoalkalibacter subterraneus]|jgi:Xaa-Pro aminopeptidase|uniref:Peptidase M24 n=1 Tax=Geoalkalibacter subterraneus TaxID=483547 RepID=A0A0B5FQ00_9BACT|nr:Xaa-Pro peptidase family protein [Geoalkalibacter subterraneus]AJF06744.1 peptidase M24 [Geoalkalibacter subterraneus]
MITGDELQSRIRAMQALLKEQQLDGALFIFPIDVYYFSATRQNGALWMPVEGTPTLLIRKSYERARRESPLSDIRPFPSSREFPGVIPETATRIGMTFDVVPVQQRDYYARLLAGREFVDISPFNRQLRSVKSPAELEMLRRSGTSLSAVFAEVPQFLVAGMREIDLAAEFECRLRKAGSEGYVRMRAFNQELFQGLAVSTGGPSFGFFDGAVTGRGLSNASPHGASLEVVERNTPILLDYTGVFQGYITDMTRIFVMGDLDEELKHAFDVSLSIQEMLRASLKPGAICEELFLQAAEMAAQAGLKDNFMGMPGEQARFVGHGVGLELDEFPVLAQGFKMALQQGQTVAIEPKFVFPEKGVIGIENTFAVTAEGGDKLTELPDNIVFM